jgi:hypothetical protein
MCRLLACLAIFLTGCADASLKDRNIALEKENQELKLKLEQAKKTEATAMAALEFILATVEARTDREGNFVVTPEKYKECKAKAPPRAGIEGSTKNPPRAGIEN